MYAKSNLLRYFRHENEDAANTTAKNRGDVTHIVWNTDSKDSTLNQNNQSAEHNVCNTIMGLVLSSTGGVTFGNVANLDRYRVQLLTDSDANIEFDVVSGGSRATLIVSNTTTGVATKNMNLTPMSREVHLHSIQLTTASRTIFNVRDTAQNNTDNTEPDDLTERLPVRINSTSLRTLSAERQPFQRPSGRSRGRALLEIQRPPSAKSRSTFRTLLSARPLESAGWRAERTSLLQCRTST